MPRTMDPRLLRAAVSALLGAIFLAGLAGETYGVHDCPHHHRDARGPATSHASEAGGETAGGAGHLPLEAPPDGPCTCVGNCHAAGVALNAAAAPTLPAALEADLAAGSLGDDGRVPRPAAYLLPFANAPPVILV